MAIDNEAKQIKLALKQKQKHVKQQVQSLIAQRVFYNATEQCYKDLINELEPFYAPIKNTNTPLYRATRFVRNSAKQKIKNVPQGRPPKFNDQQAIEFLNKKIKTKRYKQTYNVTQKQ